jgi:hypothetical protein
MSDDELAPRQAWSLNGEHIDLDPIDCASGVPYIALRVRGPRGGRMADLYLNPGHVEQLESALAKATLSSGGSPS